MTESDVFARHSVWLVPAINALILGLAAYVKSRWDSHWRQHGTSPLQSFGYRLGRFWARCNRRH